MKNKRLIDYQETLYTSLQDQKAAQAYLNAALMDEDPRVFLLALRNVLEANDCALSSLAKKANLNRENLYRMLSKRGNPKLTSVQSVLGALKLKLAVQTYKSR